MGVHIEKNFSFDDFKKSLKYANYAALNTISHEMLRDTNKLVPRRTGKLRRNGKIENLSHEGFDMTWVRVIGDEQDAAGLLYEGINPETHEPIKHWTTAGTGGHWMERALDIYGDAWWSKYNRKFMDSFKKK